MCRCNNIEYKDMLLPKSEMVRTLANMYNTCKFRYGHTEIYANVLFHRLLVLAQQQANVAEHCIWADDIRSDAVIFNARYNFFLCRQSVCMWCIRRRILQVPTGTKTNLYCVVDNSANVEHHSTGKRRAFDDDVGVWTSDGGPYMGRCGWCGWCGVSTDPYYRNWLTIKVSCIAFVQNWPFPGRTYRKEYADRTSKVADWSPWGCCDQQ